MTEVTQATTAVPGPKSGTDKALKPGGSNWPAYKTREQFWWNQDGTPPKPQLENISPTTAKSVTDPDFTLYVYGTGFTADSVILWDGNPEPTTMLSETILHTGVRPSSILAPAVIPVEVRTGLGNVSNALMFEFT